MKIFYYLGIALLAILTLGSAQAQLSKQEVKEWKKKKKSMSPEELKNLMEENTSLKEQVSSMGSQVSSLQARISDKDNEISELQSDLDNVQQQLSEAKKAAQAAPPPSENVEASSGSTRLVKGVVFKVQIGAFKNKDLSKYFDKSDNFGGESNDDGAQRITLGSFMDYWEADTFKKYLREMGVKDAWIVSYKDGTRVPLKDVLEGVI